VIASHYAEPVSRLIGHQAELRAGPSDDADVICSLERGEHFLLLDDSVGYAWGYAGKGRRVGYVRSDALSA
jgi:hypothetical protein